MIVSNLIRSLEFVPEYKDPIKEYGEEYGTDKTNKHDFDHFFTVLQDHEARYRQYVKKREQRSARDGSDAGSGASAAGTTLLSQTDSHEGGTGISGFSARFWPNEPCGAYCHISLEITGTPDILLFQQLLRAIGTRENRIAPTAHGKFAR